MAQGSSKLGKARHNAGALKRKAIKSNRIVTKGEKLKKPKVIHHGEIETTKTINRKNEALMAARAINSGTQFFLSDVKEKGKMELKKQLKVRDKKEKKKTSVADKVRDQIDKLKQKGGK